MIYKHVVNLPHVLHFSANFMEAFKKEEYNNGYLFHGCAIK